MLILLFILKLIISLEILKGNKQEIYEVCKSLKKTLRIIKRFIYSLEKHQDVYWIKVFINNNNNVLLVLAVLNEDKEINYCKNIVSFFSNLFMYSVWFSQSVNFGLKFLNFKSTFDDIKYLLKRDFFELYI